MALTDRRKIFIEEYLRTFNASGAARLAGYANPGQQGHSLLKTIEIAVEIQRRVSELAMSSEEVLIRLGEQARADMGDFVSFASDERKTPDLDLKRAMDAGKFHLVKKLKYSADGGIEFELYDAQAALFKIAQIHGLLVTKTEVTGKDGKDLPVLVIAPGMLDKLRQ